MTLRLADLRNTQHCSLNNADGRNSTKEYCILILTAVCYFSDLVSLFISILFLISGNGNTGDDNGTDNGNRNTGNDNGNDNGKEDKIDRCDQNIIYNVKTDLHFKLPFLTLTFSSYRKQEPRKRQWRQ